MAIASAATAGRVPAPARLSAAERRALRRLADDATTLPRHAQRARMVLLAADGHSDREVAVRLGASAPTVGLWRSRYAEHGLDGLRDRSRPGRPSRVAVQAPTRADDATRDTLLEAAARMIVRRGFASTRVADIAQEVGVSPATVHYYFKTKEEILVQALLWTNERLVAWLDGSAGADADDPMRRLARFIDRTMPYPGERRDEYLLEIDLWSWLRLHSDALPEYEAYSERWIGHVAEIVQEGIDAGAFQVTAAAHDIAERLVAMTDGLAVQSAIGAARMPPARARALLLGFATEQLGLPPAALG